MGNAPLAESFVRLGHVSPRMFWQNFNGLNDTNKAQFKGLVARTLALINVPNPAEGEGTWPLSTANNSLSNF